MTITKLPDDVAIAYKHIHDRLTLIIRKAYAGKFSGFESVNRDKYTEARAHIGAIEDSEGEALEAALLAAGAWLAKQS